jgi:hypothetical protein
MVPGTIYVSDRSADSIWLTAPAFFAIKSPYMLNGSMCSLETPPAGEEACVLVMVWLLGEGAGAIGCEGATCGEDALVQSTTIPLS